MSTKPTLRIALWQCEQHPGDVAGNIARLRETALRAAARSVDLLVCPEMVLTGYNIGAAEARRHAEAGNGPSAQTIAALAKEAGVAIVWGFPEVDAVDPAGAVHNAAQLVDAEGLLRGVYRKTHLYGDLDRAQFTASDGTCPVFELLGWRIGLLICYDVEFPEAVRRLALAGADLVAVPTANMLGFESVPQLLVPARACENQLFVAYANCCGSEGNMVYGGQSVVAGPDGRLLARADVSETLLVTDLELASARKTPKPLPRRPAARHLRRADARERGMAPRQDAGQAAVERRQAAVHRSVDLTVQALVQRGVFGAGPEAASCPCHGSSRGVGIGMQPGTHRGVDRRAEGCRFDRVQSSRGQADDIGHGLHHEIRPRRRADDDERLDAPPRRSLDQITPLAHGVRLPFEDRACEVGTPVLRAEADHAATRIGGRMAHAGQPVRLQHQPAGTSGNAGCEHIEHRFRRDTVAQCRLTLFLPEFVEEPAHHPETAACLDLAAIHAGHRGGDRPARTARPRRSDAFPR